jgi:hypothetical protein
LFARLVYYGVTQLGRNEEDVWLMAIGDLLDQWEIHKQFIGMAKPKDELFIDDIILIGI